MRFYPKDDIYFSIEIEEYVDLIVLLGKTHTIVGTQEQPGTAMLQTQNYILMTYVLFYSQTKNQNFFKLNNFYFLLKES